MCNRLENAGCRCHPRGVLQQPFNALFCDRFRCPTASYEERAFRKCLYWHARLLAAGVRKVKPDFFAEDLKFIRNLGAVTGLREASAEAEDFQQANRARPSFFQPACESGFRGERQPVWHMFCFPRRAGTGPPCNKERSGLRSPGFGEQSVVRFPINEPARTTGGSSWCHIRLRRKFRRCTPGIGPNLQMASTWALVP